MQEIIAPCDRGFDEGASVSFADSECLNLIPIPATSEGTASRGYLRSMPGIEELYSFPDGEGAIKQRHVFGGVLYVLTASALYNVASDGTPTSVGAIDASAANEAYMADNGEVMSIVLTGVGLWYYDTTNGLVQDASSELLTLETLGGGAVESVCEIDGVFMYSTPKIMFHSSLVSVDGGKSFNVLEYEMPFLKQSLLRVITIRNEVYACSNDSIKPYRHVDQENFEFVEIPNGTIERGILYRGGIVAYNNTAYFWGGGKNEFPSAWALTGGGGTVKFSTDAIDKAWQDTAYPASTAYAFTWNGHQFVGFYNPTGSSSRAFLYGVSSSLIYGRSVWLQVSDGEGGWRSIAPIECYGKLYGFKTSANIGEFSDSVFEEFGDDGRVARFSGPYLVGRANGLSVSEVELICETGNGLDAWDAGDDIDPQVLCEYSKDGGETWISKGYRSLGKSGERTKAVAWRRFGRMPRDFIPRFTCDDNVSQAYRQIRIRYREEAN